MNESEWREKIEHRAKLSFEKDDRILAVLFYGSCVDPTTMDRWSDVDLMIILRDDAFGSFDADELFRGEPQSLFSKVQENGPDYNLSRLCFEGFLHLDLTIHPMKWLSRNHIPINSFIIANRLPDSDLLRTTELDITYTHVEARPNLKETQEFLHKLQLAVAKFMREDLLIGAHLTLDLYRDALVVLMKRRDNECGTSHHRYGGSGNS